MKKLKKFAALLLVGVMALALLPPLSGWRGGFAACGFSPRRHSCLLSPAIKSFFYIIIPTPATLLYMR